MSQSCKCSAISTGVQTFRIRDISADFEKVADLKPDLANSLDRRSVWACRGCGQHFACIEVPFKDAEEFLIRMNSPDWQAWNWSALPAIAEGCRWRGPQLDARFVL